VSAHARFESAVLPHLDAAYTLARYLTREGADAEDVVQEAMLRAIRGFEGFRGTDADARAWLLAIVRNTCFTWLRRNRPGGATLFDESLHSAGVEEEHPEAALLRSAQRETLAQALDRLPPEFREVVVLRDVEGLSYKEIADVIGAPLGTVMSRLSRARDRLQRVLGEDPRS